MRCRGCVSTFATQPHPVRTNEQARDSRQSFVSAPRWALGQVGQLVRRTLQTRAAARPALPLV